MLQHVPLKHRCTSCCIVSTQFRQAALAATTSISFYKPSTPSSKHAERQQSFSTWLANHGSSLTSLAVSRVSFDVLLLLLQCPNLQQLKLSNCRLSTQTQLPPGTLVGATLTVVDLNWCTMQGDPVSTWKDLVSAVAGLTALQSLTIRSSGIPRGPQGFHEPFQQHLTWQQLKWQQQQQIEVDTRALLPGLSNLNQLCLENSFGVSNTVLQGISCLDSLQSLKLAVDGRCTWQGGVGVIQHLPHLIALDLDIPELQEFESSFSSSSSSTPELSSLSGLSALKFKFRALDPGVLQGMRGLTSLVLDGLGEDGKSIAAAPLLQALQGMQQLRHFHMSESGLVLAAGEYVTMFTSLLANSNMESLSLSRCWVPQGIWSEVFVHGKCANLWQVNLWQACCHRASGCVLVVMTTHYGTAQLNMRCSAVG